MYIALGVLLLLAWPTGARELVLVPGLGCALAAVCFGSVALHRVRLAAHLALALFIALAVLLLVRDPTQVPFLAKRVFAAQLRSVSSPQDLEHLVAPLGIVLRLRDGTWLAIRYHDSHVGRLWSQAVALDSDGRLYQSEYHFCGTLNAYRLARDGGKDWPPELAGEGRRYKELQLQGFGDLHALAEASTLEAARQVLPRLGFEPY